MVLISITSILALVVTANAVSRPPGIFVQPSFNIFYKAGETVQMPCEAEGEPRPSYYWKRNEVAFNPSGNDERIVQLPNSGTLVLNKPEDKDEAMYQCFAENDFGTSMSIVVNLREAKLLPFAVMAPQTHRPQLGRPFTLECTPPESVPRASVIWVVKTRMGGIEVINYDDRVSMDREYSLRFTNVKREDSKNGLPYACYAMNEIMRKSEPGPLHFIEPAGNAAEDVPVGYLWADQDDRFGLRGDTFNMKCIFYGNPTPDVHWQMADGRPLPDRAQIRSMAQELEITDLQFEDEGQYECWATNTGSTSRVQRSFNVRVRSKPYFLVEPEDVEIGVGGDVKFQCRAGGRPEPDIKWYINGVPFRNVVDERFVGRLRSPLPTVLALNNVVQTDHMVVQCNASNTHGYVFADVYLNVLAEEPTIIVPPLREEKTAEGQSVELLCKVTGKPDPVISWSKDGQQITGGRYTILPDGDLRVKKVVLADAGSYQCMASNIYNTTSARGVLVVRRKTRIEQRPGDLEVIAGRDAKFTCSGTTDPEEVDNLQILWKKDGKFITSNDQRMTTNYQDNSLTISGTIIRDSGTYTCVATNGLDEDSASAVLTVRGRPDAPTNVYIEFCDTNATIHWMPGSYNNAPIQYYVLQYNTSINPDQWNFGLKVNSTLAKTNFTLSPYVTYAFRIIAYNKIGPSDPSFHTPQECKTKPAPPAYHPRNLRTIGFQPNVLYIEWTPVPPLQQNGEGFFYTLEILKKGEDVSQKFTKTIDDWEVNHFQMNAGIVYTPYEITITSDNSEGPAPQDPVPIIGYTYESTPTISPTNLVLLEAGDTFAHLQWDFLRSEIGKVNTKIRGEFMGFKIQFWEYGKKIYTIREQEVGREDALNSTGNVFTATVENMLPNTRMEAHVSVMNNFYIGKPTDPISFTTKSGLPGQVEYLRVINIGDTHINLEWGPPDENWSDLVGFDISYRRVNGLDLSEMQDREPQLNDPYATNAYLSGLLPSSKYRIYIYARTVSGRGEGYFIEVVTAKPGTPRMPKFSVAQVHRTSINVTWWINAFADSGTIVFVEYRKLDGAEWLRTTDEVVNTWKNIDDLEPGTTYELRIKATNGKISVASGIEEVTTDGTADAYALIGNIWWFIGMLLSLLFLIGIIIFFVICHKRGFRFEEKGPRNRMSAPYSDTARVAQGSEFGPEPQGYHNDYYDNKYHDFEDDNRPPSYESDKNKTDYEPYEKGAADPRDKDYDARPTEKGGPPRDDYYDQRDGYDRRDDDYYGRNYDYDDRDRDYYDRRDDYDYDRQDDHYDQRDDYYDGRDGYDRRDDYYDRQGDYDQRYDHDQRDDYDRRYDYDDRRDYSDQRDNYDRRDGKKQPSAPASDTFV